MSLRLSGDAGGDPPVRAPQERESVSEREFQIEIACENKIECLPYPDTIAIHHPVRQSTHGSDFFPVGTKERLRDIVKKSKNPRRSLAYLQSKVDDFLGRSSRIGTPSPLMESARCVATDFPVSPLDSNLIVLDQISYPMTTTPHPTPVPQPNREYNPRVIAAPSPATYSRSQSTPDFRRPQQKYDFCAPNQEEREIGEMISGQEINRQSMLCEIKRFYAGSNHRFKLSIELPTNSPFAGLLSIAPFHGSTPLLLHSVWVRLRTMADSAALAANTDGTSATAVADNTGNTGNNIPVASVQGRTTSTIDNLAASSHRRKGKETVIELGTEKERTALVVNMRKAWGAAPSRFLAVGVFLSILAVSSKTLIDNMKRFWRIRGHVDMNQYQDRRFVLQFSEEGDFLHVTRSGPWRFRDDAVLVEELKEGVDPETVRFTTIPIWAQFKNIPFYLLSQQLARELGENLGKLIKIDNDARGDICNKIIRARVLLPIDEPL